MGSPLFTLSGATRAALCPGSMALTRVGHLSEKADVGNAGHEYTQLLIERGRDAAEAEAPAIAARWGIEGDEADLFFWRARVWDPGVPSSSLCELPLAYFEDGTVHRVVGGRGRYEIAAEFVERHGAALFAGSIDCGWSDPGELVVDGDGHGRASADAVAWCADWKWGREEYVPPVGLNQQVRFGSLLLARWSGAQAVVPTIVFPGQGPGRWDVPLDQSGSASPLRARDLDEIEAKARRVAERGREQRRRLTEGRPLDLVTGAHCDYCPSRAACPAHVAEARTLVTGSMDFTIAQPLTQEQARWLAEHIGPAAGILKAAREALKRHVQDHGPIELADGRVFGPQATMRTTYRTRDTFEELLVVLEELVDQKAAARIADGAFATSRKAIEKAVREARTLAGMKARGIGKAMKELIEAIEERGGIDREPGEKWCVHWPGAVDEEDDS